MLQSGKQSVQESRLLQQKVAKRNIKVQGGDKKMKKEERKYDRKEFGTAGKLIGLIYERSPIEYMMMTSAEFTNEELKTLQAMLENHMDEGITIIGKEKELSIDALYEKLEPEKESGGIEVPFEKLQEGWLSVDVVNKIVALSQKYSEFYDKVLLLS